MATALATLDRSSFLERLSTSRCRVLISEYEGVLAPSNFRGDIRLYRPIAKLLDALIMTAQTQVVLITRGLARDLRVMLPMAALPEIWGLGGLERLTPDGKHYPAEISRDASQRLSAVDLGLEMEGLGGIMEIKPGVTTVHWGGLSQSEIDEVRARVYEVWLAVQPYAWLVLLEFEAGVEFRVRCSSKAETVNCVLRDLGDNAPAVAYLGDDEQVFQEVNGRALAVLVRTTFKATAADLWIRPRAGVVHFLEEWMHACSLGRGLATCPVSSQKCG